MNEQRNLYLAIGISIAIIIFFQILIPTQPINSPNSIDDEVIEPATSIENSTKDIYEIKPRDVVISESNRVTFKTNSVQGSINLKGGFLDDLTLSKYKESLDQDSENIHLLSPNGSENPYFIETGWISSNNKIILPDQDTVWKSNSAFLSPTTPVTLEWSNEQNVLFKKTFTIDKNYMFSITQEIINNSNNNIEIYPYRVIKRINTPDTIGFFILHEGLISLIDDELLEKNYDDIFEDCTKSLKNLKKSFCDKNSSNGGWLGFTDKYWMSALIPEKNQSIRVEHRHSNNGRDNYSTGYIGEKYLVNKDSNLIYQGQLFVGAKKLDILSHYDENLSIPRFTDAIDWGWFSFLTKPVSYAINWFHGYAGNFGLAIIAFTILMRLLLFPLAQASFKSMAKMKKLQPDMQRLKETYPNDRQKMQQELMALYKREGANPLAGCLPILVQIPIFFSLYKVLFVTIEMYHAPFYGWIHDLSAPDPLGLMTLFGIIKWNVPPLLSIIDIGILPIFMGFTMWLQQKLNPAPADPTQARIFALLPFVFTFVLAGFAAGLVLYWSVNNILSIAQQWFIQRRILAKNG